MTKKTFLMDSVLDLNSTNVWTLDESQLATLWEQTKKEEEFALSEDKLLNVIRLAFEVVHYNPEDVRDVKKYENGEWAQITHCKPGKGRIALRKKVIKSLSDLGYENIKHISASTLLELIDRNFGCGWESISPSIRDVIISAFDISSTQLPASRIHAPGGTLERKVALGYEVLEIAKGTWVEAIFAKKKDPVEVVKYKPTSKDDSEEEYMDENEDELNEKEAGFEEEDDAINENDDTFYSSFSAEAVVKDEDEEDGFSIEGVDGDDSGDL